MNLHVVVRLAACLLPLWLGGCAQIGPIRESTALKQVLAGYREASALPSVPAVRRGAEGSVMLERGAQGDWLASVTERPVSVGRAMASLLELAELPVVYLDEPPSDRPAPQFARRSLPEALALLLADEGLTCTLDGQVAVIRRPERDVPRPPRVTLLNMPLHHAQASAVKTMMAELYPVVPGSKPAVTLSAQPGSNSMVLLGEANALIDQARTVRMLDQPLPHVLIETLMVTLESGYLERFNNQIANLSKGRFENVTTRIGESVGPTLTLGYNASAHQTAALTAYIDLLVSNQEARVIARPYVATISGNTASINLTNHRYVQTQEMNNGTVNHTPVSSGVTLSIQPTVLPGRRINMRLDMEESSFVPSEGNVALEVAANKASTTMITADGKTIVIGGLKANRATGDRLGLPYLRDVPGLEYVTGTRSVTNDNEEVLILVTPHVWHPGMETPLAASDALWVPDKPGK